MIDIVSHDVGKMFDQSSSQSHIDDLQASAYAKHGKTGLNGQLRKIQLAGIPLGIEHIDAFVMVAFIMNRVEVTSTGEN